METLVETQVKTVGFILLRTLLIITIIVMLGMT